MKYFYCTRFQYSSDFPTEYYCSDKQWRIRSGGILPILLFENEKEAAIVIKDLAECDWHCVILES